jgi:hypothetical protein
MAHMTHEDYLRKQRERAVRLAKEMLAADDDMIVKCRELLGVLHEIEEPREEPFLCFVAVVSETDHLPLTVAPELLDSDYRLRVLEEAREAAVYYRDGIREACAAVIARYSDA